MSPEERARSALGNAAAVGAPDLHKRQVREIAQAIQAAVEEEREACAAVAGTMAERPYDVEPEFSACLAIEAAIRQRGET